MIRSGEVKVGDQIDITYTQAVAISVEKVEPLKRP
jgi:MOSC domain-containing protein YiiM